MPQLLIAALVAVGGYFGWKSFRHEWQRVNDEMNRTRNNHTGKTSKTKPVDLRQDPETGVYHPRDENS